MADIHALDKEEIAKRFGYHKGTDETIPKHTVVRESFKELASILTEVLPPGRARQVAFTELENASMWANKAVAELAPVVEE